METRSEYILTPASELRKGDDVFLEESDFLSDWKADFAYGFCTVADASTSCTGKRDASKKLVYKTYIRFLDAAGKKRDFLNFSDTMFRRIDRTE